MSVKIRLRRLGAKKAPFYRIVVADSRKARDGRFIEQIGYYDPLKNPPVISIDAEKALKWLAVGAQPSDTVASLLKKAGVIGAAKTEEPAAPVVEEAPVKPKGRKKAASAEAAAE